jgi:hypothetical protein
MMCRVAFIVCAPDLSREWRARWGVKCLGGGLLPFLQLVQLP